MNCFTKILIFLGLKQKNTGIQVRKKLNRGLSLNIDRNRIKDPELSRLSQPRSITRGLYTNKNCKNLSPKLRHYTNNDEVRINITEMEDTKENTIIFFKDLCKKWWYSLSITGLLMIQPNIQYY